MTFPVEAVLAEGRGLIILETKRSFGTVSSFPPCLKSSTMKR
jgi:hypothetical protein